MKELAPHEGQISPVTLDAGAVARDSCWTESKPSEVTSDVTEVKLNSAEAVVWSFTESDSVPDGAGRCAGITAPAKSDWTPDPLDLPVLNPFSLTITSE